MLNEVKHPSTDQNSCAVSGFSTSIDFRLCRSFDSGVGGLANCNPTSAFFGRMWDWRVDMLLAGAR